MKSETDAAFLPVTITIHHFALKVLQKHQTACTVLDSFSNMDVAFGFPSKRVNKIEVCVEKASGVFHLRVVADVFIQDSNCRPLD